MNKKEKIERFKQQIAQLTKELKEFEAKQERFKVGDIVKDHRGSIMRITETRYPRQLPPDTCVVGYGFFNDGRWRDENTSLLYIPEADVHKVDVSEWESALRKEWNRRCTEAGWDNGDEAEVEADVYNGTPPWDQKSGNYNYSERDDELWVGWKNVYKSGKWATPKQRKNAVKFFEWDVAKTEDTIQIGCQKLSKYFLMGLQSELRNVSDKTVQEVLDELKKLDL